METLMQLKKNENNKIIIPIKGFQKTSLIDFPGKISSIIFLGGCNFRCHYCYNPDLIFNNKLPIIPAEGILRGLEQRKKYIEAVVITGGEPTLCKDLPLFIKELKSLGFAVKLDTNGSNPSVLRELLNNKLLDYAAIDIKAPPEKYPLIAGMNVNVNLVKESAEILLNSGVDYEFRTTLIKEDHSEKDILSMAEWIKGAKRYCLQQFRNNVELVNEDYKQKNPYSKEEMETFKKRIQHNFGEVIVRVG